MAVVIGDLSDQEVAARPAELAHCLPGNLLVAA